MADTKISALSAGTTPSAGNTTFVAVQSAANVKLTDAAVAAGVKATYGLTLNNATTSDPTVNSDTTAGYTVGSRWTNTSTGAEFIARSVTAAAAAWQRVGAFGSTTYLAAFWYPGMNVQSAAGAALNSANVRFHPFIPNERVTISDLAMIVSVGAAGNAQLAIWASDPATNMPTGLPLGYTLANLSTASAAAVPGTLNANVTCEGGRLYYLGITTDQTTATFAAWSAAWGGLAYMLGDATSPTNYQAAVATSMNVILTYTHTFANGLNTLNVSPGSVTRTTTSTTMRAALLHFKTASPTP